MGALMRHIRHFFSDSSAPKPPPQPPPPPTTTNEHNPAVENTPPVPVASLQDRLNRLIVDNILSACLGSRCKGEQGALQQVVVHDETLAGTSNPYFFDWSAGMCLRVEVNDIEELSSQLQPIG